MVLKFELGLYLLYRLFLLEGSFYKISSSNPGVWEGFPSSSVFFSFFKFSLLEEKEVQNSFNWLAEGELSVALRLVA